MLFPVFLIPRSQPDFSSLKIPSFVNILYESIENHELSLEYDNNPIESIKTRVKSYDSILKKIRRKNIPLNLRAIEDN